MTSPLFPDFMRGYLPLSAHVSSGVMTPLRRRRFWGQQPTPAVYLCIIWGSYCLYFNRDEMRRIIKLLILVKIGRNKQEIKKLKMGLKNCNWIYDTLPDESMHSQPYLESPPKMKITHSYFDNFGTDETQNGYSDGKNKRNSSLRKHGILLS